MSAGDSVSGARFVWGGGDAFGEILFTSSGKKYAKNTARNRMVSGLPLRAPHISGRWGASHTFERFCKGI